MLLHVMVKKHYKRMFPQTPKVERLILSYGAKYADLMPYFTGVEPDDIKDWTAAELSAWVPESIPPMLDYRMGCLFKDTPFMSDLKEI